MAGAAGPASVSDGRSSSLMAPAASRLSRPRRSRAGRQRLARPCSAALRRDGITEQHPPRAIGEDEVPNSLRGLEPRSFARAMIARSTSAIAMAARASDKTSNWRRTAIIYLLAAAVMVGLAFAAWPKPIAMIEAFTAGVAVGGPAGPDADGGRDTACQGRHGRRYFLVVVAGHSRGCGLLHLNGNGHLGDRGFFHAGSDGDARGLDVAERVDRLKRMRQIPDVPVLPCSKCGSTDWATTDKFVVRRDEPQQSASEDARATPPAEPSS